MDEPHSTRPHATSISIPNLAAELEFFTPTVVAGDEGRATLVLRNTGLAVIDFESDSVLNGRVMDYSKDTVASDGLVVDRPSIRVQLAYKQVLEIPVIFGTSSSHHEDGRIPPGNYLVGVQLPVRSEVDAEKLRVIEVPAVEVTVLSREQ
jgi:hypothetical protein